MQKFVVIFMFLSFSLWASLPAYGENFVPKIGEVGQLESESTELYKGGLPASSLDSAAISKLIDMYKAQVEAFNAWDIAILFSSFLN